MKISNRLKKISSLINDDSFLLDVGCDHGLLDIYTVLNKKKIKALAVDINEQPLLKAKENIKKYNLEESIKTSISDGLEVLTSDIDVIVISGMGGILIKDIILKDINKITNQTLILCPNNDSDVIRKSLTKNNFKLEQEFLVEDKYIYEILVFKKGKDKLNKKEIKYGKYFKKDTLYKKYFNLKLENLENIKNNLPKKYIFKKLEIIKKIRDIKSII